MAAAPSLSPHARALRSSRTAVASIHGEPSRWTMRRPTTSWCWAQPPMLRRASRLPGRRGRRPRSSMSWSRGRAVAIRRLAAAVPVMPIVALAVDDDATERSHSSRPGGTWLRIARCVALRAHRHRGEHGARRVGCNPRMNRELRHRTHYPCKQTILYFMPYLFGESRRWTARIETASAERLASPNAVVPLAVHGLTGPVER